MMIVNNGKPQLGATSIYFVWVGGYKPTCELLYGMDQNKDSHDRDKKQILQKHELIPEYKDLSLNQLALIFPYKEE